VTSGRRFARNAESGIAQINPSLESPQFPWLTGKTPVCIAAVWRRYHVGIFVFDPGDEQGARWVLYETYVRFVRFGGARSSALTGYFARCGTEGRVSGKVTGCFVGRSGLVQVRLLLAQKWL
jgi:hypothetical protein